jgi:glutamine synthetase
MFCDVHKPDGSNYEGDPRYVLKRALAKADAMGYKVFLGPELEYFYFSNDKTTQTLDKAGYFDVTPRDEATDLRRQTVIALEQMDIKVEYSHHEVAPSQHEIDLRYNEALKMADTVMTYRMTVKEIAAMNGVYATFMPKPIFGQNGSGMHTHQSLFSGSKNAFFDAKDQYFLSEVAKMYIEGLLRFAPEITAVTNQWVNSYKRLVPGYEAPVYVSWARANRSALVRVPLYKPGKETATRCELRCPDPACNPYLAFAVMISAGLKGIEEKFELRSPTEEDIFEMNEAERAAHGITSLPGSLAQAIELAEGSSLLKEALGDHVFEKFIANKKLEWDMYRTQVHQYELDKYLPLL